MYAIDMLKIEFQVGLTARLAVRWIALVANGPLVLVGPAFGLCQNFRVAGCPIQRHHARVIRRANPIPIRFVPRMRQLLIAHVPHQGNDATLGEDVRRGRFEAHAR